MAPNVSTDPAAAARPLRGRFIFWVLGLAVILGALFHESLLGGKGLVPVNGIFRFMPWLPWLDPKEPANMLLTDQYLMFVPQHEFLYQHWQQGHFPLWNPYIACGVPNLGSFQGAQLFPINLLLLPIPPFHAAALAAFIKLFLAGWFTMLYLRQLGVSHGGALLSGLVFSLSGFMIVWLGHPHVNSAMWLPLMLYLNERFFQCLREKQSVIPVCAGHALVLACVLTGGHPPTMIHVLLFDGIYFLFRWLGHFREHPVKPPVWWAGTLVMGFLLAAPAILPFLEYDHYGSESAASAGLQRTTWALPLKALIFYILPHLSGSPTDGWQDTLSRLGLGNGVVNFNERTGYVGVLPLLFALYAVVRGHGWVTRFYAVVITGCLLIIYGMPPLPAIIHALPILHAVNHQRLVLVVGFGVAVLAGIGWDCFQSDARGRWQMRITAGFWVFIGLVLLWGGLKVAPQWHLLSLECRAYLEPQFLMLGGSLLVSLVLFLPSLRHQHPGWATALVLGWAALDLLTFAGGYNPAITHDRYYPTTPAINWLERNTTHERLIGQDMVFLPNVSAVYGLRDARGCDFITVRRYEELITGGIGDFSFYLVAQEIPRSMPLLGVKYWLAFNAPNPDPSRFELVYSNEISIYRYLPVHQRALVVYDYSVASDPKAILSQVRSGTFDPEQKLLLEEAPGHSAPTGTSPPPAKTEIVSDQADSVTINADLPQPGFLLLLDTYFPGWTASVNGQPAHIYRADYNFRAVQLPAGKSTVCFEYQPRSFRLGLMLAAVGGVMLAVLFFISRSKRPKPKIPPAATM